MTIKRASHITGHVLALAMLLAIWVALAPIQLGGSAAYVIVSGSSMEPLYHRGDLVLLRAVSSYKVGDIVTYRHPQIGPVIHRIIGRDAGQLVLKGDNNGFNDAYRPTEAEVIGAAWLHVPAAGAIIGQLRSPPAAALLVAGGVVALVASGGDAARRRRRGALPIGSGGTSSLGALVALTALALVSALLSITALTRPTTRQAEEELPYRHIGAFGYAAPAPAGTYDRSQGQVGEPVFRRLTSALDISFDYRLDAELPIDVSGTHRLVAEVSADNGWRRTIELHPSQAFSGARTVASGRLELAQAQAAIDAIEQQTGVEQQEYFITIVPELNVTGALAGQPLRDTFAPRLVFRMNELQLVPVRDENTPFAPVRERLLRRSVIVPNTLPVLWMQIDVSAARVAGSLALAGSLAGLAILGWPALMAARRSEVERIRLQYGWLLIDAAEPPPPAAREIAVARFDELARLAERRGALVLHETDGATHRYTVPDGEVSYYYRVAERLPADTHPARVSVAPTKASNNEMPESPDVAAPDLPADWQANFLTALRETGLTTEACRLAEVSILAPYREREDNPAFAAAWAEIRDARGASRREAR